MPEHLLTLPVGQVRPNPDQPRQHFDKDGLRSLARSIDEDGQAVPALVRECPEKRGMYELIAGERRWRAISNYCEKVDTIDAVEVDVDSAEALRLSFVENENRRDLQPLERARAMQRLMAGGATQADVARMVGRSETWVSFSLSLLKLDPKAQALMSPEIPERRRLKFSAGVAIARAPRSHHHELAEFALHPDTRLSDLERRVAREFTVSSRGTGGRRTEPQIHRTARSALTQTVMAISGRLDSTERVIRSLVNGAHFDAKQLGELRDEVEEARDALDSFTAGLDEAIAWLRDKRPAA